MQQRVGLARALVTDPDILLMDEPFSALDPLIRNKLQDELLSLQQRLHKTIIFVTHDLDEALKLGNRIAIMKDGQVIQVGAPEDIVLRPATEYVAEFVRHMNPLTAIRAASLMRPLDAAADAHGAQFTFADGPSHYRLSLRPDGTLDGLSCNGAAIAVHPIDGETATPEGAIGIVETTHLLKDVVEQRQRSGHPVLVAEDGRIVGWCGANEVLDALTHAGRATMNDASPTPALATS
jgi:glycine betaine/proline transport system ATP-binding protein